MSEKGPLYLSRAQAVAAPGEIYEHYKGGVYRVLHRGVRHSEREGEVGVVYEHLWPNPHHYWYRPEAIFDGKLEDGRNRFTMITKY